MYQESFLIFALICLPWVVPFMKSGLRTRSRLVSKRVGAHALARFPGLAVAPKEAKAAACRGIALAMPTRARTGYELLSNRSEDVSSTSAPKRATERNPRLPVGRQVPPAPRSKSWGTNSTVIPGILWAMA